MTLATGYGDLAARLASAVGLPPNRTQAFSVEVFRGELIRVRADLVSTERAVEQVARIFETAREGGVEPAVSSRLFIPTGRLEDLRIRFQAGTLTVAEQLALAVLTGGPNGEEGFGPLIDAAQEEHGYGSYRVPVRVVSDPARTRFLVNPPPGLQLSDAGEANARRTLEEAGARWLAGEAKFLMLPAGWTVQVIEVEAPAESNGE